MTTHRIAIVQRYVPRYREPFFSKVVDMLGKLDIEVVVVAGTPADKFASRRDAVTHADWLRYVEPRHINLKPVNVPFYGTARHWRDCDGVIFTLLGNSFDLNAELLKRSLSHRRIAVWGHVGSFNADGNSVDLAVERHQMRLSDHVFAYTQPGADIAIKAGVDPADVTPVMNSIDVSEMLAMFDSLESETLHDFQQRHGLTAGKTFGYIGGLDAVKRVDMLVEALDILWDRDPQVKLVIGGRGDQERLLSSAAIRGQVVQLGYAGPQEKALINHVSEAVLNPGGVGLLAVECLAVGMPILTTDRKHHGPEYEYLAKDEDVFVSADDPEQFANLILSRTTDTRVSRRSQPRPYPSVDGMVSNFRNGVLKMMS